MLNEVIDWAWICYFIIIRLRTIHTFKRSTLTLSFKRVTRVLYTLRHIMMMIIFLQVFFFNLWGGKFTVNNHMQKHHVPTVAFRWMRVPRSLHAILCLNIILLSSYLSKTKYTKHTHVMNRTPTPRLAYMHTRSYELDSHVCLYAIFIKLSSYNTCANEHKRLNI